MRLAGLALVLCSCALHRLPLKRPPSDTAVLMVASYRLEGPLKHIARHATFVMRMPDADEWIFYECCQPGTHGKADPFEPTFGDDYWLHAVFTGDEAAKMIDCVYASAGRYGYHPYWAWPGHNSNTFVDFVLRDCHIPVDLPPTCVGKDYRGLVGASLTSGGTGVQVESPILGLRVGLKEGIELHVLALTFGIDFWPPALLVPFEDGRIGFADR